MERVELITKNKTGIEFYNSKNIEIKDLKYQFEGENSITVNGPESSNIKVFPVGGIELKKYVSVGKEVPEDEVTF
jgi:hypothetical protein